jgi:hypothetical protein
MKIGVREDPLPRSGVALGYTQGEVWCLVANLGRGRCSCYSSLAIGYTNRCGMGDESCCKRAERAGSC